MGIYAPPSPPAGVDNSSEVGQARTWVLDPGFSATTIQSYICLYLTTGCYQVTGSLQLGTGE